MRKISCFLCLLLFLCLIVVPQSYGQSIVIKFRSEAAVLSPTPLLRLLSQKYLLKPLNQAAKLYTPKVEVQNPQSIITIGLERIVIASLKDDINASTAASDFASLPEVEWAEPNYIYHIEADENPNDSLFSEQWSHELLEVQKAWKITKGDSSIKIGFIDTGVEWFHPDLIGQFAVNQKEDINRNGLFDPWPSTIKQKDDLGKEVFGDIDGVDNDENGFADDVIGYDFVDQQFLNFGDASVRDPIPNDEHAFAHGTAVAGVIAARDKNRIGIAGIAPGCRLVALRAFDATGNAEDDDIASAIIYAADNGIRILNLSFGDIWPSLLQRDAIRYAESKGCLVFASSGNRGGSGRHYPSDFDECVSVGATTINDGLWFGTVTGEGMDVLAPGNNIITTDRNGDYQYISGTSFSSPAAAAVAGLVLSINPLLSPRELRSILKSTTDDLFPYGYDHQHANGRINAHAAVTYKGSASIKITFPNTNDGFHSDEVIPITGSATSTFFTGYTLFYAKGLNPDIDTNDESLWTIIKSSDTQIVQGILGSWNTAGLPNGTYTLRLAVRSTNADRLPIRSTEERITVEIKNRAPEIIVASLDTIFIAEKSGLIAQIETDTLTYATLLYRKQDDTQWLSKNDDRYSRKHAILLTTEDVAPNTVYEVRYIVRNSAGDTASADLSATMPEIGASQRGFIQKSYSLPPGFVLDTAVTTPQGNTVIESVFPAGGDIGPIYTYRFDTVQRRFRKADSTKSAWVPRDIGSIDGISQDLMLAGGSALLIYRNDANSVLGNIIRQDSTARNEIKALGFTDPDGNGTDDIVAIHQAFTDGRFIDLIEVRSAENDNFPLLAVLPNTTSPAPSYRDNKYQKPDVRSKDLTGDGKEEIVILDDDADLLAFSRNENGAFEAIAIDSNHGSTEGTMVAIGDLNGDGKQDIAFAFHTSFDENVLGEYDPKYWTVKILFNNGDGSFKQAPRLLFWNARSDALHRSSMSVMKNVTGFGADELALSFFPDFYLFKFDALSNSIAPLWHFPVSVTPRTGLAFDFDGNGIREFALNSGDSTYFFEREYLLSERTASPSGVEAIPRDTDRVDLKWAAVPGAVQYYILRAPEGQNTFDIIDSTTSLFYSDTTVANLTQYIYSVAALDPSRQVPLSEAALAVEAFVHPKPIVSSISSHKAFVKVKTSQPLRDDELEGAGFIIDGIPCLTAAVASDSSIVLHAANELLPGTHELQLRTHRLRDIWNSPLDTGLAGIWEHFIDEPDRRFYIVKWRFEGNTRIAIEFNSRPADNALDIGHYILSPYGTLVRAYRDDNNPNGIFIDLANTQIVALGIPFVLCAEGITDELGTPIEKTEGNCIGVTLIEPNLANIMVYPNPAHPTDDKLTFARLTAEAEVSIFTVNNRFLRRIRSTDRSGGVEWDLRDEAGKELPSGVYIYHVTGKDEHGNDVEPNGSKFVLIRGE